MNLSNGSWSPVEPKSHTWLQIFWTETWDHLKAVVGLNWGKALCKVLSISPTYRTFYALLFTVSCPSRLPSMHAVAYPSPHVHWLLVLLIESLTHVCRREGKWDQVFACFPGGDAWIPPRLAHTRSPSHCSSSHWPESLLCFPEFSGFKDLSLSVSYYCTILSWFLQLFKFFLFWKSFLCKPFPYLSLARLQSANPILIPKSCLDILL